MDPSRVERKGAWGVKRLMFTAAASPWLSLGLTRCYYRPAKRRESKSAASDTQTFSAM